MASPTTIVENTRILVAENCHVDFTNPCTAKSKIRGFAPDIIQELILKKTIQVSLREAAFYRGTVDGIPVVAKIVFGHDIAKLNLRKEDMPCCSISSRDCRPLLEDGLRVDR